MALQIEYASSNFDDCVKSLSYSTRPHTQERQKLAANSAKRKGEFRSLRDGRAHCEDIIILTLDGMENREAPAAEEIEVDGQLATDHADQGHSFFEESACKTHLIIAQGGKPVRQIPGR